MWPSRNDLRYGCFRVTRIEGGLDLVAIREQDDEELVVIEATAYDFGTNARELSAAGWCMSVDSIRVTPDGVGGFSYLGLMYRDASNE